MKLGGCKVQLYKMGRLACRRGPLNNPYHCQSCSSFWLHGHTSCPVPSTRARETGTPSRRTVITVLYIYIIYIDRYQSPYRPHRSPKTPKNDGITNVKNTRVVRLRVIATEPWRRFRFPVGPGVPVTNDAWSHRVQRCPVQAGLKKPEKASGKWLVMLVAGEGTFRLVLGLQVLGSLCFGGVWGRRHEGPKYLLMLDGTLWFQRFNGRSFPHDVLNTLGSI